LKSDVTKELERFRAAGELGSSTEANVTVHLNAAMAPRYQVPNDELRFLLITGDAVIGHAESVPTGATPATVEGVWIEVKPSAAPKCVRCYQRRADVGGNPAHPEICARCVTNVEGPGEVRHFA
jgi:isoleucyl-tRNA synthetase